MSSSSANKGSRCPTWTRRSTSPWSRRTDVAHDRLDDLLEVRCWVSERKRASFRFAYEIVSEDGETVATGATLHACLDPATSKMIAMPPWLRELMPVVQSEPKPSV